VSRTVLLTAWAVALAAVVLCVAVSMSGRWVASLRDLRFALRSSAPRMAVVLLCWAWVGWHFFAR
jgi:hypothetical protein